MSQSISTAAFIQPAAHERALFWCVLASLALHALVLLGLSPGGKSAPPAKTLLVLTARLGPIAAPPRAGPQPSQPEPVPTQRPVLSKSAASPAPSPQKPSAPAESARPEAPETAPAAPGAAATSAQPAAAPAETKPASQSPAGIPSVEASAKSGTDVEAGTIEQYRLALIVAARR